MFSAASATATGTEIAQRENQPSLVNRSIASAGQNTCPRLDAERGATRTIEPAIATTTHQRMTSFSDALVSWSCRYKMSPIAAMKGSEHHVGQFTVIGAQ